MIFNDSFNPDCDASGVPDSCEVDSGALHDCNHNGRADVCERDCNSNGFADECDIAEAMSADCNTNDIPDECERDCNSNGIPDDCESNIVDCNSNGIPDTCDIASGNSRDINGSIVPDECEDLPVPVGDFADSRSIGQFAPGDRTRFNAGTETYTMVSSGEDIWNDGDDFRFAYKGMTGDFVATARITEISSEAPGNWGKAGIMARYTVDRNSKNTFAIVPHRGDNIQNNYARFHQTRRVHLVNGSGTGDQGLPTGLIAHPYLGWVRLTRHGRFFYSEFAEDDNGQPRRWFLTGGDTHANPPPTILAGFAVSPHPSAGSPILVRFDRWALGPFTLGGQPSCGAVSMATFEESFSGALLGGASVVVSSGNFAPSIVNGRLRLTRVGITGSATGVAFPVAGTLGDTGFSASFDAFYALEGTGGSPGEGLTLAVFESRGDAAPMLSSGSGPDLGYRINSTNVAPIGRHKSFAVELDYQENGAPIQDPSGGHGANTGQRDGYHVGLNFHQTTDSAQTNVDQGIAVPPFLDSSAGILIELRYLPVSDSTSQIDVWITDNDGSYPRTNVISAIGPKLDGQILFAFTASTGNSAALRTATQEVDNFVVRGLCCEALGSSNDCNSNGVPDACDLTSGLAMDCNANGLLDQCDVTAEPGADCNMNGVPDECDIAAGTSSDGNSDGVPDDCQRDVMIEPVAVSIDPGTTSSARGALPVSTAAFARGSTFWLEVWASDVGITNSGLTAVYVNVSACGGAEMIRLFHGDQFTQFPGGALAGSGVDEFGGSALPSGGGVAPQWVRIGWIEMRALSEAPACSIRLFRSAAGVAAFQRGEIDPALVGLGSLELVFGAPSRPYDLDESGQVGVGDLSLFAGSWLQSVPPANASHDFDCDDMVGVGDLSWFATGWLKPTSDPSIHYPPCTLGAGGGGGALKDVTFQLVATESPSPSDAAGFPPDSLRSVDLGEIFFLELWAIDSGDVNTGLTSAYVDVTFPSEKISARGVMNSSAFGVFPSGTVIAGGVDELGGSNLEGKGNGPEWARIAIIEMRADAVGSSATFSLLPSSAGVAAYGRGIIPWSAIDLPPLGLSLGVVVDSFRRSDANADGRVDLSDAVSTLNWLFLGNTTLVCPDAGDANDDSKVDLSDAVFSLNWLFSGGPDPEIPGPHSCGIDPTPDGLPVCAYPPGEC